MFEKEAERNAHEHYDNIVMVGAYETGFIDGAEFVYDFAKKWHYVKDKLPPSGETVLLYYGADIMGKAVLSTGCIDCNGEWYKNVDEEPFMWQEITLPKD